MVKVVVKAKRVPVEKPVLDDKRTARTLYGGAAPTETTPAAVAKKPAIPMVERLYGKAS